jgi:branched-subunit amino acid aminotransferase/4-amino-4-deoxychorismate lyase
MEAWRWNNGAFAACREVPLTDRGFRYGMSLFESFPVCDGAAAYLDAHLTRLRRACALHGFGCDPEALAAVDPLLRRDGSTGWARIYVTAGDGGPTDPNNEARLFVFIEPRERPRLREYSLLLAEEICRPLFGGIKTANYWANLHELRRAHDRGADEALLFNHRAELVSACCGNVFLVRNGVVRTPALHCGGRDGVIRELVMGRITVEESSLFVDDVRAADEIFVTNSWIGVMPVSKVEDHPLRSQSVAQSVGSL